MSAERETIFEMLHSMKSWTDQLVEHADLSCRAAADLGQRIDHLAALMDINAVKALEEQDRLGRRDDPLVAYLDVRRRPTG